MGTNSPTKSNPVEDQEMAEPSNETKPNESEAEKTSNETKPEEDLEMAKVSKETKPTEGEADSSQDSDETKPDNAEADSKDPFKQSWVQQLKRKKRKLELGEDFD